MITSKDNNIVVNEEKTNVMSITTYQRANRLATDQFHVRYDRIELQNVTTEKNGRHQDRQSFILERSNRHSCRYSEQLNWTASENKKTTYLQRPQ